MNLDICMASDDNYAIHMGICIISIAENNSSNINVHILNNNISEVNLNKLKSIESSYKHIHLYFYDINRYFIEQNIDSLLKDELSNNDFYKLLGTSAFARLFLEDILPANINKVLYLDSDTIVLNNLEKLFEIDLTDYYVAGVIDILSNVTKYFYEGHEKNTTFINSGVLVINLEKWRKIKFKKSVIDLIKKYPNKNYLHDQNIINILCANKIFILNPKFNVMSELYYVDYRKNLKMNSHFGDVSNFYTIDTVENALKKPIIVHFLSQVWDRPWFVKSGLFNHKIQNPFNQSYIYYRNLSPWKDLELDINSKSFFSKLYYELIRFFMMNAPLFMLITLLKIRYR